MAPRSGRPDGRGAGEGGVRPRHDDLPSGRHVPDGPRRARGRRRSAACPRGRGAARYRCIGDAAHHLGQHQRADLHERGARRRIPAHGRTMKHRVPIAIGLLVAFVAGAWALLAPPDLPDLGPSPRVALPEAAAEVRRGASSAPAKIGAASLLAIDSRANPLKARATAKASLFNEFLGAKRYKALYDRLKSSPEGQTAEGQYVMYEILRKCATITDRDMRRPLVRTSE